MITLTHLFVILLWYAFGWLGSFLLLLVTLFGTTALYRTLHLENEKNITNIWRKSIARLYDYLDFDWVTDELEDLRLSYLVVCIMAALSIFGTYTFIYSFALSVFIYVTILLWYSFKNK